MKKRINSTLLERRMRNCYTFSRRRGRGNHGVWLTVGNQTFELAYRASNKTEAGWMQLMLGKALAVVVNERTPLPPL